MQCMHQIDNVMMAYCQHVFSTWYFFFFFFFVIIIVVVAIPLSSSSSCCHLYSGRIFCRFVFLYSPIFLYFLQYFQIHFFIFGNNIIYKYMSAYIAVIHNHNSNALEMNRNNFVAVVVVLASATDSVITVIECRRILF